MKFFIVASFADSLIRFRGDFIAALLQNGCVVEVAVPRNGEGCEAIAELSKMGVVVHFVSLARTGMNPIQDLRTFIELLALMIRRRPDAVLSYTIKPVIYGSLAAWLARVPLRFALITGLGYAFQDSAAESRVAVQWLARSLYRHSLRKCQQVFFQNGDDEALFREIGVLEVDASTVVVNGSGVNTDEFSVCEVPSRPSFLLIARLLGDKGVREYVTAARRVKVLAPEAVFRLAGWIDDNPNSITEKELDEWVREGVIQHLGRLSDVRPALAECSVYVLPSYREGTPRTVLEAMATGRAIITTDAPGCRQTVEEGVNGFLVPVRDVDALTERMLRFVKTPSLAASMGKESRRLVSERFDVHEVNRRMLSAMGLQ